MPISFARLGVFSALVWAALPLAAGAGAPGPKPFHQFVGQWIGNGQIIASGGHPETIHCKAQEAEEKDGEALDQTIVCASDSYKLDITSYVEASADSVQGNWNEATRQVSGHLSGRIAANKFEGRVAGPTFSATISLSSDGRKQSLEIKPSAGDVSDVHVEFRRQG